MNQNREDLDDHMFLWVVLLLTILVVIPAIYAAKAGYINRLLIVLAKMELRAFVPFSEEARIAWAHILGLDPAMMTWEQAQGVLIYAGKWIRWPFVCLLALFGATSVFMGRIRGLARRLDMESLLRHNAESFACLKPVVGRGQYLLSTESYDSGLWRIGRSPVQFALEHELLVDGNGTPFLPEQALHNGLGSVDLPAYGNARLDEEKALAVLLAQLGPAFTGFEGLTPIRKALAAAFIVYAGGDKKGCVGILDAVSNAYAENDGKAECPILTSNVFVWRVRKWKRHQAILSEKPLTRHNAFELVWFMALLNRARQKGVLAGSQFLWLRPLDRPLWYALNQCGGRVAWAESFAPWAHYIAEEKAGQALPEAHVASAVVSLREALSGQGWLADTPRAAVSPSEAPGINIAAPVVAGSVFDASIEPIPDIVYAEAEDDQEEYNANADPHLAQEQC